MKSPLKIGLIMRGGRGWIGGADYIRNLILALGSLPDEVRQCFELYLITNGPIDSELQAQIAPYVARIVDRKTDFEARNLVNKILCAIRKILLHQDDARLASFCRKTGLDFVYPFQGNPGRPASFKSAAWLPDFQHKHLPHFFTPAEIRQNDKNFSHVSRQAKIIVLSSQNAAKDFVAYFPEQEFKSRVLPFAVYPNPEWFQGDPLAVQREYHLPDRFFLISNQFWQHKNHLRVFEALQSLKEQGIVPTVVCTGHIYDYRKPEHSDTILQSIQKLGLARQVHLLGLIPRQHQIQLMRRCVAVVQPSLFEGWSTVVEDAKTLGKPIILSDLAVHEEQHPQGLFFDRLSTESLMAVLTEAWDRLDPGPDVLLEEEARSMAISHARTFGYQFLELAGVGNLSANQC